MTVTAAPQQTPEERLRSRALDTLRTAALEAILASDEPLRTVDLARQVADDLDLTFNEEELGGLASVVRMVLDSDPLFSQSNRQWDLALRMGRAEGDRRKPVGRAVEDFVDLIGHPADTRSLAVLVASVYRRPTEYYERVISQMAASSDEVFRVDGKIGVSRWLLEISSDEPEDVEYDNFDDTAPVEALRKTAKGIKSKDPVEYAKEIIRKAGDPVDNRALQFLTWCAFPDVEPDELFAALYEEDGIVLERGPAWVTADARQQVVETIRTLARDPENVAEIVAANVPTEEEELGLLAPTTVRVSDEDLEQVAVFMAQNPQRTYRVPDLCQQVLEAFPGSRTYSGIHDSLLSRMREDDRFYWLGTERFRLRQGVTTDMQVLPEGMNFDDREYLDQEGQEVDRVVDPSEWKPGLEQQIMHYLVQDVGDDSSAPPAAPPSRLESSPPLHHYVAGTRYLRNADRGFFPSDPDIVQVTLITGDDSRFDVWVNNRLGMIFGLKEWYDANLPWVGGKFTIARTDQPDEYQLTYTGETDPLVDIPLDRLQQLLQLRGEAEAEKLPLTEIITRLLRVHQEGIHFVTLFTELNVVRRTRRGRFAGILSSQRYFVSDGETWRHDEKRAQKTKGGKKKGGPKRIREVDEDEDEEFEYE